MLQYIQAHWVEIVAILTSTWTVVNATFSRVANSLPAPTAQSTPRYIWWFQFVNNMALNTERAKIPQVENSPNFQAAVNIQTTKAGLPPIVVDPPAGSTAGSGGVGVAGGSGK